MAQLPHILVTRAPATEGYTYPREPYGKQFRRPSRDRAYHAQQLAEQLNTALRDAAALHPGVEPGTYPLALEFRGEPGYDLLTDALENRPSGVELANVHEEPHEEGIVCVAAVRVPPGKESFFERRISQYRDEDKKKRKEEEEGPEKPEPRHRNLIESITNLRLARLASFWTDRREPLPPSGQRIWWEVWIECPQDDTGDRRLADFRERAGNVGLQLDNETMRFRECAVLLAYGAPEDWLGDPVLLGDYVNELRKAREFPEPYVHLPPREQREFIDDLLERVTPPPAGAPAVCLLDTGVAWGHPLLRVAMGEESATTANPDWRSSDHKGHGTEMAGLSLYGGDLPGLFAGNAPVPLSHTVESVKILPPAGNNDPKNDGVLMENAVRAAERDFASHRRAFCMAATRPGLDQGYPSLCSAAVDKISAGGDDGVRRLFCISAGNVDIHQHGPDYRYLETNRAEDIEDPGQSWNALTVGAYTDLVSIGSTEFRGWNPVAPKGGLCPTSRASTFWSRHWPLKPDIVLEGGNWAMDPSGRLDSPDNLALLTTGRPTTNLLAIASDTSAATALAARLAAMVQARYPRLWPETVRGLLVHSAEWTPQMLEEFGHTEREQRLRCYGYGVPDFERAVSSMENAVTLVFQGELQPFQKDKGRTCMKDMHFHALPWPTEVLRQYGTETVRMRVTLSYFIEPSPGGRGQTRKHTYRSHGLRFGVKLPTEGIDEFRKRMTKSARDENEPHSGQEDKRDWVLGDHLRRLGSIHSDWWQGPASDLADSGHIAVFPVAGWWRDRPHLGRWDSKARYSLIVSLETDKTDIHLYTAIATEVGISSAIET